VILDTDHDGMLSIDQLWQALHMIAFYRTKQEIARHIVMLGGLKVSERISMVEYLILLQQMASEPTHSDFNIQAYRAIDRGVNGYITIDQLKQIEEQLGGTSTDDSFNEFARSLPLANNRVITIDEMIALINGTL
jgi:Ca2+-binding EF-hand superfamily protein